MAEYPTAIRLNSGTAETHYNLGTALATQVKLEEAAVEFCKARQNAQRGSSLAQLIDRALNATGQ